MKACTKISLKFLQIGVWSLFIYRINESEENVGYVRYVEGVTFLLGNDIASCRVIPDPVVCSNPLNFDPAVNLTEQNPGLFPSCVVTRSQSKDTAKDTDVDLDILGELFTNEAIRDEIIEEPVSNSNSESRSSVDIGDVPVTRKMLVESQRADPSLGNLLDKTVSEAESEDESESVLFVSFKTLTHIRLTNVIQFLTCEINRWKISPPETRNRLIINRRGKPFTLSITDQVNEKRN